MPRKTLTIIGILLIFIQISGIPHSWKTFFGILVGIYLVFIAIRGSEISGSGLELKNKTDENISFGNDLKDNAMNYDSESNNKEN